MLRPSTKLLLSCLLGFGLLVIAAVWLGGRLAEQRLSDDLRERLRSSLDVHVSGLLGDLDEYPAALTLLGGDPRILRAVVVGDQADIGSATALLRQFADLRSVDDALIVRADGTLIADHENDPARAADIVGWLRAEPAFAAALSGGLGRAFGIAAGDGARRYVFARRIANPGKPPALLAVTVSLDYTELLWRLARQNILVVDRHGTVVLSADQRRPLQRLGPPMPGDEAVPADQALPCREGAIERPGEQLCVARPIARLGWDMYLLGDMAPVHGQVRLLQWALALGLISLALLAGVILQRRLAMQRTLRFKEETNRQLQRRVDWRTTELRAANRQLEVEIDQRIAKEEDLRQAQAELVQTSKLAALGQLSAGIAHQLNQPLAALRAYADNARTFLARGQADAASENLGLIADLTERIGKITRDLKVLARRQPTRTEPVALDPLVRSVIDQTEKADATRAVRIVYDRQPLSALAEPVGLQQVLVNLVENGLDAMETGRMGGTGTLTITSDVDADRIRLSVVDEGTGIDEAIMDNIFDPFFTTKDVGKGLGLGLSLSASMIQDMGGRLTADNRPEGGAVFTIELQLAAEDAIDKDGRVDKVDGGEAAA